MKLHLGCGWKYLEGYLNIDIATAEELKDFPRKIDLLQDLTTLKYDKNTIDEIRNHHVFEHFTRPMACALLVTWSHWLIEGGTLHIEVPDFYRTSLSVFNPFNSFRRKGVGIRHVFGSHEASWAIHAEGYTQKTFSKMLTMFGFEVVRVKKQSWKGTYNIELFAKKVRGFETLDQATSATSAYLSNFLVDETPSELKIKEIWLKAFLKQVQVGTDLK